MARRSTSSVALATGIACALVAGAIATGLRLPAEERLSAFPARSVLDYDATFRSALAPLRSGFIREILGGNGEATSTTERSIRGIGRAGARTPELYPRRTVVDTKFTNDDMASALVIERMPFTGRTDTRNASRESGDPDDCASVGGTAWYRYASTKAESLIANTFGTDHAIHLGVYERSSAGSLMLVGCDADVAGTALVQFPAQSNTTYLFQITDDVAGGKLVFNLEPTGTTELISRNSAGEPALGQSFAPSISGDGKRVAFYSFAHDAHPDTPREPCHASGGMPPMSYEEVSEGEWGLPCPQVYVRDRSAKEARIVSVSSSGEPGNLNSMTPWLSGNGRYVGFSSGASNLVAGDTNHAYDIFVHDLDTRRTERVSVSSDGDQIAPDPTRQDRTVGTPSLAYDGRFVAFSSVATNLVPGDTNGLGDVFVHDRVTRRTERVSRASDGGEADGPSVHASLSPDGRYVVFLSTASNLTTRRTSGRRQVFVHDRKTRRTEIVSISSAGEEANMEANISGGLVISAGGRSVVFESQASNLVDEDTNNGIDIFVHDRSNRRTERVSLTSSGDQPVYPGYDTEREGSRDGAMSASGRYVAFTSGAENLAEGRRNARTIPIHEDLYVRDLWTHTTAGIVVAPEGAPLDIRFPFISADGRSIGLTSLCYTECDSLNARLALIQVWVHDRPRGTP